MKTHIKFIKKTADIEDKVINNTTSEDSPNYLGIVTGIQQRRPSDPVYTITFRDFTWYVTDKYIKKYKL